MKNNKIVSFLSLYINESLMYKEVYYQSNTTFCAKPMFEFGSPCQKGAKVEGRAK